MNTMKKNFAALSAVAITIGSFAVIHADDNPFTLTPFTKSDNTENLAMGSCGQGMCGGNMDGMQSGNMPQGIPSTLLPNYDSKGAKVLMKNCTQCHGLPAPGLHTSQEWPAVVKRMERHMEWSKKWMQINIPSDNELTELLNYLQENAQKPIDTNAYPDLNSESGKDFSQICAQCHVLPDPMQHSAEGWPAVIDRMLGYMTVQSKQIPNEQQVEKIVEYLKSNAKKS